MTDATTEKTLQDVLRRESSSLLQYIGEIHPWVAPDDQALLARFNALVDEDRKANTALGRFMQKHRLRPTTLGPDYPARFTGLGFVGLRHMLPALVESQREAVARLEQDHAAVPDADARAELWKMLEMKKRHLAALEELAAGHPPVKSA